MDQSKKKIILIGGGGHCKSCIDVIKSGTDYNIAGIVERDNESNINISDVKIIGTDDDLNMLFKKYKEAHITIGQIENFKLREKIYKNLKEIGYNIPTIKAANSYTSELSSIGEGNSIMFFAFINSSTTIGNCNIINTGSLIEHDCHIENFNHISTGCVINGTVTIGSGCFIGSRVVINNNIKIADNVVIGSGSVVVKDITKPGVYFGNPAKYVRGINE